MKLSSLFNKPRWQSKDAAIRRAGVASDDDTELVAALATIAREDDDAGVRVAAMKRLADPGLTQRLAHEDADPDVRADARALWLDLLAGNHPRSPSAVECARLLRAQDDVALIEHVARSARDATLRAAALAHATRPAFLVERATGDADSTIRLAALDRIDDEGLLERLAERARKTDKTISRRARERAETLRIGRGDSAVAQVRAKALCERIEQLVREPRAGAEDDIDTQWHRVAEHAGDALRARYAKAKSLLATSREPARPAARASARLDDGIAQDGARGNPDEQGAATDAGAASTMDRMLEAPMAATHVAKASRELGDEEGLSADAQVDANARGEDAHRDASTESSTGDGQAEHGASNTASSPRSDTRRAPRPDSETTRAAQSRLDEAIAAFAAAVAENAAARAHEAHAEIVALRKAHSIAPSRPAQRALADAERDYTRLREWQQWSDNQRRRALCESVEAIAGSGLHPDAIATRVREAQHEWSRLDATEGHAKDGAQHALARRFHATCRRAIEPARTYFRARDALRKTHAEAIAATLAAAQAMPYESEDGSAIAKQRLAVVEALRGLDRVEPGERKSLAKSLKAVLTSLVQPLARRQAEVESAKSALIAEAEALATDAAPRAIASTARALQQRWRDAGNGRRDRDQAQWKRFRGALDAAFGKLDAERADREARDAGARDRAASLCVELEALAAADGAPARASVAALENAWETLAVRDESLARRFRAAQSAIRDATSRRENAARRLPYDAWLARYRLVRVAEQSLEPTDALREQWNSAPATAIAAASLTERFESAATSGGTATDANAGVAFRETLVRLELFAGVESPEEDRELRRALQVDRLAARMRGGAAVSARDELVGLLEQWTSLPACESMLDERLKRVVASAILTLP